MIPVEPQPEPAEFHERCRVKGQGWLSQNPGFTGRPKDFWTPFEAELHAMFHGRCGWMAMLVMRGQIDHFISVAAARKTGQDHLAYEWSNFRYSDGWINQKKGLATVLDPFLVQPGWFRLLLPSLQLVATDQIPTEHQEMARFTLKRLGLTDSEVIVRYRSRWFQAYRNRKCDLDYLKDVAPLIAVAVEEALQQGKDWRIEPPAPSGEEGGST